MAYGMILVDFNQLFISSIVHYTNQDKKTKIDETTIRHIVLNTLRSHIRQFKQKYADVVICCDSKTSYWRKDVFPYYKANRKTDRDKIKINWTMVFEVMDSLKKELAENFPYKVIDVEGAEADDIIAVLSKRETDKEILILSSDKDFMQLQKYPNVTQYSPTLKRFIKTESPEKFMIEHILRGDRGDGIPNFLSADDSFVRGERQKRINTNMLNVWITELAKGKKVFTEAPTMIYGYVRNETLINFDKIPMIIETKIIEAYDENKKDYNRMKMMNYFIQKKLVNLMDVIQEF